MFASGTPYISYIPYIPNTPYVCHTHSSTVQMMQEQNTYLLYWTLFIVTADTKLLMNKMFSTDGCIWTSLTEIHGKINGDKETERV